MFDCYKPQLYLTNERWSCGCPLGTHWWHARHTHTQRERERRKDTREKRRKKRSSQPCRYTVYGPTGETLLNQQLNSFLVVLAKRRNGVQPRKTFCRRILKLCDEITERIFFGESVPKLTELYPIITCLFAFSTWSQNFSTLFLDIVNVVMA